MEPLKELLLHPEINLNQRYGGETPLNAAISNGRSEAAALLLHYGADPNIPGERDTFPLTSSIKTLRSHPITSRLLRMTTPSTDFSFDLSSSPLVCWKRSWHLGGLQPSLFTMAIQLGGHLSRLSARPESSQEVPSAQTWN